MGVPIPPHEEGLFLGKGSPHFKVYALSAVSCAETAEPIDLLFGLWTRIGTRNHVLDGGPAVMKDVAMATNY